MTKIELARLACAVAIHRPDWPEASLRSFLETHLAHRPYLDVAVALTWIAVDPDSRNPGRVLEAGPWWQAASTRDVPTTRNDCRDHPHAGLRVDQATGRTTCAGCWADNHGAEGQPLRRRGTPIPTELRQQMLADIRRDQPSHANETADATGATP